MSSKPSFLPDQAQRAIGKALNDGDFAEVDRLCDTYLKQFPDNPQLLYFSGVAARGLERFDEAVEYLTAAASAAWLAVNARLALAETYMTMMEHEKAIKTANELIELQPESGGGYYYLGIARMRLDQPNEAISALRKASILSPELGMVHFHLGNLSLQQGDTDGAIKSLRKAADALPESPDIHNNLGLALRERGMLEDAESSLREAIRLSRKYAQAHFNLHTVLMALNREGEASGHLELALDLDPSLREYLSLSDDCNKGDA